MPPACHCHCHCYCLPHQQQTASTGNTKIPPALHFQNQITNTAQPSSSSIFYDTTACPQAICAMASSQYCRTGPVLLTLTPLNTASTNVQEDFRNRRFCKRPDRHAPSNEIYITFNPHRGEGIYPSTIGRTGHIMLRKAFPANIQCAFEIHKDTGEVMLVDKSPNQTCYVRYTTKVSREILDFRDFGAMVISPQAKRTILHSGERGSPFLDEMGC
ncbi:hypothetical protein EDB82DRAFT_523871 [Fusarium venenatum]|uniref:uncharacterized protein n=1 Tax=Fusarium venenatum TaxID=56646 RepID=UPI001E069A29|nr:hypothetical protein EDB82DRAFT_523871 [Fusarium venenatum]